MAGGGGSGGGVARQAAVVVGGGGGDVGVGGDGVRVEARMIRRHGGSLAAARRVLRRRGPGRVRCGCAPIAARFLGRLPSRWAGPAAGLES